jgi:hypothetical protein
MWVTEEQCRTTSAMLSPPPSPSPTITMCILQRLSHPPYIYFFKTSMKHDFLRLG